MIWVKVISLTQWYGVWIKYNNHEQKYTKCPYKELVVELTCKLMTTIILKICTVKILIMYT